MTTDTPTPPETPAGGLTTAETLQALWGCGGTRPGGCCRSSAHNYAYWNRTCQFANDAATAVAAAAVQARAEVVARVEALCTEQEERMNPGPIPGRLYPAMVYTSDVRAALGDTK